MNTSFLLAERNSAFHMRRPTLLGGGFVTDVDPDVDHRLRELDELLGKHILPPPTDGEASEGAVRSRRSRSGRNGDVDNDSESARLLQAHELEAARLLEKKLAPWRPATGKDDEHWPTASLANILSERKDRPEKLSLADHIDLIPELASLKYDLQARLGRGWFGLNGDARAVLRDRPNICDYLIARAYHIGHQRDQTALFNYLIGNRNGVRSVIEYAAISAARTIIDRRRLQVPDYRKDDSDFTKAFRARTITLSATGFQKALNSIANDVMFNAGANALIEGAGIGDIPDEVKPKLIRFIQTSKVPITKQNVKLFLPGFVTRAYENDVADSDGEEPTSDDSTYAVQFRDRADAAADVDRDGIRCAAQLFHAMVVGEELGVFDAFQYLVHSRMLLGGGMAVRDKALRDDLRLYTLSNEYRDLGRPGHPTEERTRAAERKMFARRVFAQGDGELIEGMEENVEFRQLWQVLMLESARYLERAQESYNPASFVSKQNVMQAIEDLQYNLSTHCVGWPQVMAPAIDAELNFVLTRFIGNEKIAQQVLPAGGSWKRIVDKLNTERPKTRPIPAAALLYAKARQGLEIINSIADYAPEAYENDREFSAFIGVVDAYITTESKLQRRGPPPRLKDRSDQDEPEAQRTSPEAEREAAPASADDEWDF